MRFSSSPFSKFLLPGNREELCCFRRALEGSDETEGSGMLPIGFLGFFGFFGFLGFLGHFTAFNNFSTLSHTSHFTPRSSLPM